MISTMHAGGNCTPLAAITKIAHSAITPKIGSVQMQLYPQLTLKVYLPHKTKSLGIDNHHFCMLLYQFGYLSPPYLAVAAPTPGRRRCSRCSSSACASRTRNPSGSWAPRRLGQAASAGAGGTGRSSGSGNCENEEGTHNPCKEKKRKQRFGIR